MSIFPFWTYSALNQFSQSKQFESALIRFGSAHEKFGVRTGPYCFLILPFLLILTSYHSLGDTKKILNIISSVSNECDMVSDQMGLYISNQIKDLEVVSLILTCDNSLTEHGS